MKKVGIALIVLIVAGFLTAAVPARVQAAAAGVNDCMDPTTSPSSPARPIRPSLPSKAGLRFPGSVLSIQRCGHRRERFSEILFGRPAQLPMGQYQIHRSSEDGQEITAVSSGWLKDIGLTKIDVDDRPATASPSVPKHRLPMSITNASFIGRNSIRTSSPVIDLHLRIDCRRALQ